MRIDCPKMIQESPEELLEREKRLRGSPLENRVKLLRLLKSASYRSRLGLAEVLGYGGRQLQHWWATYRKGGLEALLEIGTPGGKKERITEEALAALEREMKEGTIVTLEEARRFSSAGASASTTKA